MKKNEIEKALAAAAKVLETAAEPMNAKEIMAAIGGNTPAAMIYRAMIREIAKKGDAARFRKFDGDKFIHACWDFSR